MGTEMQAAQQVAGLALLALSGLLGAAYVAALAAVRRRGRHWQARRTALFAAGLGVVAVGPNLARLGVPLGETGHMVTHLALIMVAPALLLAGRPGILLLHATGNPWHRRIRRLYRQPLVTALSAPPVAVAAYTLVLVATHLTGLRQAAMTSPAGATVEALVYLLVGLQTFGLVFGDEPVRWRLGLLGRLAVLLLTMPADTFTGVALMQGGDLAFQPGSTGGGTTDLQTAGAVMWVGGDGLMVVMAVALYAVRARWRDRVVRRRGLLEQARRAQFAVHTGTAGVARPGGDLDEDDTSLVAYNAWLARLARRPS